MNTDGAKEAKDVPIGFGLGLAMNEQAMRHYGEMTEEERSSWLTKAGQVSSKEEMQRLVEQIEEAFKEKE